MLIDLLRMAKKKHHSGPRDAQHVPHHSGPRDAQHVPCVELSFLCFRKWNALFVDVVVHTFAPLNV